VSLRKKILATLGLIVVYRVFSHIPLPTSNPEALKAVFQSNQALGYFSLLTGGSMENFSIVLMGLSPYINASIIIQLLCVIIPKWEHLKKEGERGQRTINKYTRWLTFPLAFIQSYGMLMLLKNLNGSGVALIDETFIIPIMLTVTAGTLFLVWLGEIITEKGIGNGVSLLIFANIAAGIPTIMAQTLGLAQVDSTKYITFAIMAAVTVALTLFAVAFTEGNRNIPITYAGHGAKGNSQKSGIPIRVNQAGMIPIIFAVSLVTFPGIIAQLLVNSARPSLIQIGNLILSVFNPNSPGALYIGIYFLLVVAFTYFYVSIVFTPETIAENIQKKGGFIPGIRPGKETAKYLHEVSHHLNLWGGICLALVAVAPYIISAVLSPAGMGGGNVAMLINGSSLIIIVGVVLELIRKVNVELVMHDYEKFV
jgi:preprotein translocase subunit SecY